MPIGPMLVLCSALVAGQAGDPSPVVPEDQPAVEEDRPRRDRDRLRAPEEQRPPVEAPQSPLPIMKWDGPVSCGFLQPTKAVPSGHYRIQCDDEKKVCLVSPTHVLNE